MDASLAADALERVLEAVTSGKDLALPPEVPAPASSTDLERHAGRYRLEAGGEIVVRAAMGVLVVEPRGPVSTRHLAFPAASSSELETIARLDGQAEAIVDGMVRGDYEALAGVMADPSRVSAYRDYIAGWWKELEDDGGGREDVKVLGTTPSWWSLGDDRLATVIAVRVGERSEAVRLHWRDGRIAGLGGGAVREPATTLFAPTGRGDFVGYHLGIRQPVRLAFEDDEGGETHVLRLHTPGWTLVGSAVDDG